MRNYQAIVLVSFGVSESKTREKSIDLLFSELKEEFNDQTIVLAYTSEIIRSILDKKGERVFNVPEALDYLKKQGIKRVFLQPTHLIAGEEYHKIISYLQDYADDFEVLSLGSPLLDKPEDYQSVANIMAKAYPLKTGEALFLMGHGSEHGMNAAYPALAFEFLRSYPNIFLGTVEGYPAFSDALGMLKAYEEKEGAIKKIYLAPLLFVAGEHAHNDMNDSSLEKSWRSQLEALGYEIEGMLQGMGELPEIRELYRDHIKRKFHRF
ncbi:MAG: sirohydrochlorin cobaltochelatase [Coriobacteriia bacterium]|nr:sirohydrochlorin cobaltochelatase [Coriobacteriia bacterium]